MPLTALLHAPDLGATRQFYQSVLGFDVRDTAEGTLTVTQSGGTLIFTASHPWGSSPGFSGTLYFTVPNVDEYFALVHDKVDVVWPLQDMPYGSREFGIRDCNGYHLAFQQQA
ncbi:MAG: VOC family protein [Burkholderiales bacterium]